MAAPETSALIANARAYARDQRARAGHGGAQRTFLELLDRAADAAADGDYAIAAACAVEQDGATRVAFGRNRVFSAADPAGHAEMEALAGAAALAGGAGARLTLYATLEPCPMCTVALLNAGVGRVVVAVDDAAAGALTHLERLGPVWRDLAATRGVTVHSAAQEGVAPELIARLRALFEGTRGPLDARLTRAGVLAEPPARER